MFIKEVILDGFKSYAQRTPVSGFDPHFNAITGLNGSGKSNILDSICFVLGISNLSLVRADNLQGLIYKKGQAGIKKASVTVVFDNSDPSTGPDGYEQYPEITITRQVQTNGKTKYLVNGHNAQLGTVRNLFHSVGLNVNNPHFLIMQGRIMQIVKMKPPEILGMLEEAAGTKMYEMKKEQAIKTIAKKQSKVDEFTNVIQDEIAPKLEKLAEEQKNYMRWTTNNKEIEDLTRLCVALSYSHAKKTVDNASEDIKKQETAIDDLKNQQAGLRSSIEEISAELEELERQRDDSAEGNVSHLEEQLATLSKELIKKNSSWEHAKQEFESMEKRRSDLVEAEAELTRNIEAKQEELVAAEELLRQAKEGAAEAAKHVEDRNRQYQAALAGTATEEDDDNAKSWADQMMQAKHAATQAAKEQKQLDIKVKHLSKQLTAKKKELSTTDTSASKLQSKYEKACQDVEAARKDIEKLKYTDEMDKELQDAKKSTEQGIIGCRKELDKLSSKLSRFNFQYRDPEQNFDRSKVKGLVAKLVALQNADRDALALQIVAGGGLYHVVTDTVDTGEKLMSKGNLRQKVHIIPLDKITTNVIPAKVIARAQELVGKENASLALSLVGSDDEVRKAIEFVFGNTLVCSTLETASTVAFDKAVMRRAVSLDGQVVDPRGSLTGGTAPAGLPVLKQLEEMRTIKDKLDQMEDGLEKIAKQMANAKRFREMKSVLQIKEHEAELIRQRLDSTPLQQLKNTIKELEDEIVQSKNQIKECAKKEKEALAKAAELEDKSQDAESQRDTQMANLEKAIAEAKKASMKAQKKMQKAEQQRDVLRLEIKEMKDEISGSALQLKELTESLTSMEALLADQEEDVSRCTVACSELKDDLDKRKAELRKASSEMQALASKRSAAKKSIDDIDIEVQKATHQLSTMGNDCEAAKQKVKRLLNEHEWIEAEQQFFGKKGGKYDFANVDSKKAKERLASLTKEQQKLSKSINQKVMNMFENAQAEYRELKEKIERLTENKKTIEEFITDLDTKKKEALDITWKRVNKDFSSIFGTLLPRWNAKLEPPEGETMTQGLRILFARDGVWKQGLSELSGGQKSLLALALILALLRVKPAPVYIFDEVDSALDLSNTQNIGKMLKKHFAQSQFLIVSLKEGMWNNANVLFRTKVVEGVSQVTRLTPGRK